MVYCFTFVLCVMHMQSKAGTNTLAEDVCKQRTRCEMAVHCSSFFCCWIAEKQQNIENKSYLSK